jgi:putative copper export protein
VLLVVLHEEKHYSEMTREEWWAAHHAYREQREKERIARRNADIKSCIGCIFLIVLIIMGVLARL